MLSPVRVVFRSIDGLGEDTPGHVQKVSLSGPARLKSLYAKGRGLAAGEGVQYRVRLYNGIPEASCYQAELTAPSLGTDARTADALHQGGLEVLLADTFWVTYALERATAGAGASLLVELMVES